MLLTDQLSFLLNLGYLWVYSILQPQNFCRQIKVLLIKQTQTAILFKLSAADLSLSTWSNTVCVYLAIMYFYLSILSNFYGNEPHCKNSHLYEILNILKGGFSFLKFKEKMKTKYFTDYICGSHNRSWCPLGNKCLPKFKNKNCSKLFI